MTIKIRVKIKRDNKNALRMLKIYLINVSSKVEIKKTKTNTHLTSE